MCSVVVLGSVKIQPTVLYIVQVVYRYTTVHTYDVYTHTGSGDLLAENFNPAWFLLERHRFSTFDVGLRVYVCVRVCVCVCAHGHAIPCVIWMYVCTHHFLDHHCTPGANVCVCVHM